jgi:hypothetical protein
MWKGIVGRFVDVAGFQAHVDSLTFTGWRPSFVVVHNTSEPDLALYREWRANPGKHGNWTPEQWAHNLASYYAGMGWSGGPHAFVAPDGILLFTPFTMPGTHSPAWNSRTWGIETVGEFEHEPFDGGTRDNLVAVLGILHARIGLNPADQKLGVRGLHFHKEDPVTTHKSCPGRHMVKADLVAAVTDYIERLHPGDHEDIAPGVHTAPTSALAPNELISPAWLQAHLNSAGAKPELAVDGRIGEATREAVTQFQLKHGLVPDGVAGPLTRLAVAKAAHG